MTVVTGLLAQAAAPPANGAQLVIAALVGIAVIVVLITRFSVHPFLALTIGSLVVAAVAGMALDAAITSFSNGFGSTAASVGTLIALGAMFGKLLADSGGATGSSTPSSDVRPPARCRGRWRWWARSSGCRCSSRSASCC